MAGPEQPIYTNTFVVDTDNYGVFIREVRQNVIKYCSDRRPGIVQPVLPPEQKVPKLWLHIGLRTRTNSLTLAIRIDNLYLVGFKTPAGVWWEFGKEGDTHLIRNSKWLGFGGRYQDLIGQKGLETVELGRSEMRNAVDKLAKQYGTNMFNDLAKHGTNMLEELPDVHAADPYAEPKIRLVKLVIMICEGMRFFTVYDTVGKKFNDFKAKTITQIEGKQVRKWDQISKAVHKWAVDPTAKFPNLEETGIKDKNDAEKVVALVKDETS